MKVGNYRILSELGRGGMGTIYHCEHVVLGHSVAMKVLREDSAYEATDSRDRFLLEAQALAHFKSPHTVTVTDFGQTDNGRSYYVMELLTGEMLSDILVRKGRLGLFRAITVLYQLAEALEEVHEKGIVHRDLKPENVHVERRAIPWWTEHITPREAVNHNVNFDGMSDFVKLIDFGIAKFRDLEDDPDHVLGTPYYMAPEMIRKEFINSRADIYGLGALFFEMLTGSPPFLADTVEAVNKMHLIELPPSMCSTRPDLVISEAAERIVAKALSKDPDRRQQNTKELRDELRACLAEMPCGKAEVA
jgi:eukaryotic-like serine/threonine-protein kinase